MTNSALFHKFNQVLRCPVCGDSINVIDAKSLKCPNQHTFDIARQGYVNMMTRPVSSQYGRALFKARQSMIMDCGLYDLLHEKIIKAIHTHLNTRHDGMLLLDAGCGEGSHLQKILEQGENMAGIGIDISKEGVKMAASSYKNAIWLVDDLANSTVADESCQVILNILSPANYQEFKRMLIPDGLMIKVVPRAGYLKELRETRFAEHDKQTYENDQTVSLFKQHFHLAEQYNVCYSKELTENELTNLVQMSPLSWHMTKEDFEQMNIHSVPEITVDLDILVGMNN